MEVYIKTNLDNDPKKEMLKNFNIAFGKGDIAFLLKIFNENIVWNMVGNKKVIGIKDFETNIKDIGGEEAKKLIIEKVIIEKNLGVLCGSIEDKQGNIWSFSDFYEFENTQENKIKSLTSYLIKTK